LPASEDKPEDERHPGRRGAWFDWQPALFDQETALGAAERCELYRASPGLRGGGFLMHNQGHISLYRRVTCLTIFSVCSGSGAFGRAGRIPREMTMPCEARKRWLMLLRHREGGHDIAPRNGLSLFIQDARKGRRDEIES